ncbi:MAG: sn-glycerol-3-phosphate ABC transporter ATP-binding protein UgpC [Phycisphaerales bacterium]
MASVELVNLSKSFADGTAVVRGVSLTVPDGAFCVLLGPSGCGKTTSLRMIAGLETISGGEVRIDGKRVNDVAPKDRDVAMVFQNYALYPHLTVRDNIAFPLTMRGVAKGTIAERVREAAAMLELQELLDRYPAQLSGGQRQRVAMARAIVRKPKVFLFDEPLSNLDARLRAQTRRELKELHKRFRITSIYVTHDQEEAMSLADMVAIMAKGELQQCASPTDVFLKPANRFVAGFIGTPSMNFAQATVHREGSGFTVKCDGFALQFRNALPAELNDGESCTLGLRPGALKVASGNDFGGSGSEYAATMPGTIESVDLLGEQSDISIRVGNSSVVARVATAAWIRQGARCVVGVPRDAVYLFKLSDQAQTVWQSSNAENKMGAPSISSEDSFVRAGHSSAEVVKH